MKVLKQEMHPFESFWPNHKWVCGGCKKKFLGFFPSKNRWIGGYGICEKCQDLLISSDAKLKAALVSTQAHIASAHGFTNELLEKAHRFQNTPGWWKSSLPKSK